MEKHEDEVLNAKVGNKLAYDVEVCWGSLKALTRRVSQLEDEIASQYKKLNMRVTRLQIGESEAEEPQKQSVKSLEDIEKEVMVKYGNVRPKEHSE